MLILGHTESICLVCGSIPKCIHETLHVFATQTQWQKSAKCFSHEAWSVDSWNETTSSLQSFFDCSLFALELYLKRGTKKIKKTKD